MVDIPGFLPIPETMPTASLEESPVPPQLAVATVIKKAKGAVVKHCIALPETIIQAWHHREEYQGQLQAFHDEFGVHTAQDTPGQSPRAEPPSPGPSPDPKRRRLDSPNLILAADIQETTILADVPLALRGQEGVHLKIYVGYKMFIINEKGDGNHPPDGLTHRRLRQRQIQGQCH